MSRTLSATEIYVEDHEAVVLTIERQRRIAVEVCATILRNLPGVDEAAADACARNIAAGFGEYGRVDTVCAVLPADPRRRTFTIHNETDGEVEITSMATHDDGIVELTVRPAKKGE